MLDRLQDPGLGLDDVVEFQGLAGRQLLENLDHHRVRGLDAAVQALAAVGFVIFVGIGQGGADALQNDLRIERPPDRVGGAQRPGLHRAVMQGIRQHEQPRHLAIGLAAQLVAHHLHAFRRPQIDVHDNTVVVVTERAEAVGRFMGVLGDATGKPVILTYENGRTEVICRWSPTSRTLEWMPEASPC